MSTAVRCHTCLSPSRDEIDTALAAGRTYEQVSAAFGVSTGSLIRHKRDGHMRSIGARPPRTTLPAARRMSPEASAYDHAARLVNDLATVDVSRLSPRERSQHAESYRRAVDTLGRLAPVSTAQVSKAEEMIKVQDEIQAVYDATIDRLPWPLQAAFALALHERFKDRKRGPTPASTVADAARGEELLARLVAEERAARGGTGAPGPSGGAG
jgi:hypothetical protein